MGYEKLLSPIKIGNLEIKNRIVKAPASSGFADMNGFCTNRLVTFYETLAKGKVGLIIMEGQAVQEWREDFYHLVGLWSDEHIAGYKAMVDKVHAAGSPIIAQFCPMGPVDWTDPRGASALTQEEMPWPPAFGAPPREVTIDEINALKQAIVDAAIRATKVGYDGVEIHTAHSYYLQSFMSRTWNKRTDQYGGSIENRARLVCEMIQEVREATGPDFIIGVRMNGEEYGCDEDLRLTSDEAVEIAKLFEKAGLNYINVAGESLNRRGDVVSVPSQHRPDYWNYPEPDPNMKQYMDRFDEGLFIRAAEAIHRAVNVPVIGVGKQDENSAEALLEADRVDMVAFARPLFADPLFPLKLYEGRPEDIVHCTRCGTCESPLNLARRCRVNPSLALGDYPEPEPAEEKKKVMVIGGGIGGMETAVIAAKRGHDVVLYEPKRNLGGHIPLAAMIKGTEGDNVLLIYDWLKTQIDKLGVKVVKKKANRAAVVHERPDAVIVATGGTYSIPEIPGIDGRNVSTVTALSKLAEKPLELLGPKALSTLSNIALPGVGKRVAIIGGEIAGLQGALFMKKRGKDVMVFESGEDNVGAGMTDTYLPRLLSWFSQNDVPIYSGVQFDEITKKGLVVTTKDGEKKEFECDTVMVLPSMVADTSLFDEVNGIAEKTILVGSVKGSPNWLIEHAMADGYQAAMSI
ncbi:NADH oxidase [Slackia heliotrinireducens]|uniref:NADH:flavin oxidoreductase n=1 Tax=Slackia heliotrinireducens (strain ATCC 29202 / DSM 20476 / NCTC 11029 / RHS 1) TaxID=471855 RepID=C7N279_SLAHD|nr:FAD-dependent oxidoreductase [Slackia heliotrinireducens]ACV21385.1 NADH:flavin oxidoreductase [Slackia heliotrinireducens DSM 20476]VEG98819.1 NADH oxidase [Slackia heliotrinireducens]